MKHSNVPRRAAVSRLVLVVACASLQGACSGYYPLGQTSEVEPLVGSDGESGQAPPEDARVAPGLAPADVTLDGEGDALFPSTVASVGDLDGDGRDEMAVSAVDLTSRVPFVHLRYGGPRPADPQQVFAFERSGAFLSLPGESSLAPSVSAAGDIDGDGYGDLLIETAECDSTEPDEGVYLMYGGPDRLAGNVQLSTAATHFVPTARVANPPPGYGLSCGGAGRTVPAGDIDGDGLDDLVIDIEPQNDTRNGEAIFDTGEGVYVFYGRSERFSGQVPITAADASFHIRQRVDTFSLGDIDGDQRAELIVGPDGYRTPAPGSFLLRGRGERHSGRLDLAASGTLLEGAYGTLGGWLHNPGDLDGDGRNEVLLWDASRLRHLFYGAPALFEGGIDFSQAEASVGGSAGYVFAAGDRDGDGDDELLDQFWFEGAEEDTLPSSFLSNVAFASGGRERLTGAIAFPESEVVAQAPDGLFPEQFSGSRHSGRALEYSIPAGDLDGDGAADLFTTSFRFEILDDNGGYESALPQIHIHYGTPAPPSTLLR